MANLPPTPAPSTDIAGKPTALSAHLDAMSLPPAAMHSGRASVSSPSTNDGASDSSYRPISPSSPEARHRPQAERAQSGAASKRRWSSGKAADSASKPPSDAADSYALPPPPTRSRKIIQMKPQSGKGKGEGTQQHPAPAASPPKGAAASTASQHAHGHGQQAPAAGGKKKQANSSTAAGRKIARKTAHSLIERRRRSKMNEEFGVLKDMIPACAGQEMHKLAILQASIEYMRYLESCVSELKSAHKNCKPVGGTRSTLPPPSYTASTARTSPIDPDDEDAEEGEGGGEDEDEEMADNTEEDSHGAATSAANTPQEHALDRRWTNSSAHALSSRPSISPAILPSATTSPLFTRPSASATQSFSNLPSPAFYAQQQQHGQARLPSLSLTSPLLRAQQQQQTSVPMSAGAVEARQVQLPPVAGMSTAPSAGHTQQQQQQSLAETDEATASALLMLTADKRSWTGRGMSVKDLLSSQ